MPFTFHSKPTTVRSTPVTALHARLSAGRSLSKATTTAIMPVAVIVSGMALALIASPAWSGDARSIALGGSAIASGQGVHGAVENPASLMAMKRRNEKFHFRFGGAIELRDTGEALDTLSDDDNQGLIDDLEAEIDVLSTREVQCDPLFGADTEVCVSDTQGLADLSTRLLDILDVVDDESLDGQGRADLGFAFTRINYPIAVNLHVSATGTGSPDIADGDRDYIEEFAELLGDNELTLQEVRNSSFLQVSAQGLPLGVTQPEDVLTSEAQGGLLIRTQLGISFATTLKIAEFVVDAGVTPKFSSLNARNLKVNIQDEFDDTTASLEDRFDDSEVTESSFTFDAGASLALKSFPVRLAAVLRNVVPESVTTTDGYEFETTPQLILGALFQRGLLNVSADMALNEAMVDNFDTQKLGVGVEYGTQKLAVRAGISHDAGRATDTTALSLGFGLGPLQFGARATGREALEAGVQLAYSFK